MRRGAAPGGALAFPSDPGETATPAPRWARRALAAAAAAALAAACSTEVEGSGALGSQAFDGLPSFHAVALGDTVPRVTARVISGAAQQSVVLSGDDNIVHDHVELTVGADGVLRVQLVGVDAVAPRIPLFLVAQTAEAVDDLSAAGGSDATLESHLAATRLAAAATDASRITLGGTAAGVLDVTLSGGSTLEADAYEASSVQLDVTASDAVLAVEAGGPVTGTVRGESDIEIVGNADACAPPLQLAPPATCSARD